MNHVAAESYQFQKFDLNLQHSFESFGHGHNNNESLLGIDN